MDDVEADFQKRLRRIEREKLKLPPPPPNPNRIFIDIVTANRYTLARWEDRPAKHRDETNMSPFSKGTRVAVIYVDGPRKGEETTVEGSWLEEETDALRTILKYQADNLQATYNQTYNRFGDFIEREKTILLRTFNPYLREWIRPFYRDSPFERVYHWSRVYNDLRNQRKDVVRLWIRATGYNIATMGFLSRADRHFREMMNDERIWFEAFQFHLGQNAMKFLSFEPGTEKIVIDAWTRKTLDDITQLDGRLYSKRLLELNVLLERRLHSNMLLLPEKISNSSLNETSTTKVPSYIWQCGRCVYALFKRNSLQLPGFLALWNAETEEPFAPPTVRARKTNVLHSSTSCEYIAHDQNGFLCYLNAVLTYVVASMNVGVEQSSARGIKLVSYPLAQRDVRPRSVFMTPRYIVFDSTLIPRSVKNRGSPRLDSIIDLPQGATALFCLAVDRYMVELENNWFEVRDLPEHRTRDASWRRLNDDNEKRFFAAKSARSANVFIYHYRNATKSLMWFDYSDFCANILWKWERTPIEGLQLLSAPLMLCDSCQTNPISVECGYGCGKAYYCGQECANIHHDIHVGAAASGCVNAAQYLRYRDTNYIYGTREEFTVWRESQIVTDRKGEVLFQLSKEETEKLFNLLNLSAFHKRTDADRPQCCDIPYRVVEYGGDWVAPMNDVPELADALLQTLQSKTGSYQQTRMRAPSSSMKILNRK